MGIELTMLAWAMVLGIVQILLADVAVTRERGSAWNVSARDGPPPPPGKVAGRLLRAQSNFLETFAFFAAAVVAVVALERQGAGSALAVQLYVWARVVYLPLYAFGVPWLRGLAWLVSIAGIVLLAVQLL